MNILQTKPTLPLDLELERVLILRPNSNNQGDSFDINALAHPTKSRTIPIYKGVKFVLMPCIGYAFQEDSMDYKLIYDNDNNAISRLLTKCRILTAYRVKFYVCDEYGNEVLVNLHDEDGCLLEKEDGTMAITSKLIVDEVLTAHSHIKPSISFSVTDHLEGASIIAENIQVGGGGTHIESYTKNINDCDYKASSNVSAIYRVLFEIMTSCSKRVQNNTTLTQALTGCFKQYEDQLTDIVLPNLVERGQVYATPKQLRIFVAGFEIDICVQFTNLA